MKLIFFGTGEFAVPILHVLQEHCVLVVSQPDRPAGRKLQLRPSPVSFAAQELGLRLERPEKSRSPEFVKVLEGLEADALVVASYGQILSEAVLNSAKRGGINLHGSILPLYRGAAPIQRCILDGHTETGVTLMQMDKGMDTGDIIAIEKTPIGPDETYGELQDRLAETVAQMCVAWMPKIVAGDYPRLKQNSDEATIAPKVEKAEAELRCSEEARQVYNRFRAFTPAPGAYMQTEHGRVKVHQARLHHDSGAVGQILELSPRFLVGCKEGSLELCEVQPEGRKRMPAQVMANGFRLKVGSQFFSDRSE